MSPIAPHLSLARVFVYRTANDGAAIAVPESGPSKQDLVRAPKKEQKEKRKARVKEKRYKPKYGAQ